MRVLIFGTFDQLHPGHRFVLEQARMRGDLTVVVSRDATVERCKGRLPIQTEEERRLAVEQMMPGVRVVLGDRQDYLRPVRELLPALILLGYDQELPQGVQAESLPCPLERLPAFHPELYKSSLQRGHR
ncbi:MAG TPA: FAD synthase [Candidatus Peribacter riflensis]|uniref:Cytidyltransferase n=1 Tax=Candidatus Peribacter riflensis TaxID=1735162 RepID=A0A0S1SMC2_9BACT|nr:MAG: cytidyltransferase [Candidatus Peribacter riflensis]OGJ76582.1 MAG: hypothetical protein A2398_04200 [Candidatus Peribacteria bacterium RIFOXYB1_FULL_57_12]OGJ82843.1 MAG: hypothetical protein A2412_01685 [Candidatus Peribacteria bacterium RIFOXYC1_FULL_58_8]ALM11487.1 MAG: cytidyltransferase [Candidatus Peribacter riflensis]ALM12589.1 MAG: cytidyltransferase [Candidatus Peribacter riflensis]